MNDRRETLNAIESVFADTGCPAEFLTKYDQLECLASHRGRETFLIKNKADGSFAVAKCYDKAVYALAPEQGLREEYAHKGLPRFFERFENEKMICLVRSFVEGRPLCDYAREKDLGEEEITDIALQLADILAYLHGQTPPLIHRDIKPENIIIEPDGNVVLIDFDIARTYKSEAESDTLFFGTRGYAAPEQYGFAQTDRRSDIYSFGVLLRWLLTNSIRPSRNISVSPKFRHIIDKCTAFSPSDRYDSMKEVTWDLEHPHKEKLMNKKQLGILLAAVLLSLLAGFTLGRTARVFTWGAEEAISFTEPLIEEAVRTQLGYTEYDVLTEEDLQSIKCLYIFGTKTFREEDDFTSERTEQNIRGSISTLDDIRLLPNLEELRIGYQGRVDISALGEAQYLQNLECKHMDIGDAEPLSHLEELRAASFFDSGVSSVKMLEKCEWLDSLDVGGTHIRSVEDLGIHPNLKNLRLNQLLMEDLDGIEQMEKLRTVCVEEAEIGDYSALLRLPHLEQVYAGESNIAELTELFRGTDTEVLFDH